jgi:hypothetical protein
VAVQLQIVDTLNVPELPDPGATTVAGLSERLQMAPACVTVKTCPAMVKVPVRASVDGFAFTA